MKKVLGTLIFALLLLTAGLTAQAQRVISGVVTDDAGNLLPGVTVLVVESNVGVVTNLDGEYSIQVRQGSTLQFSFVGMSTLQVSVGDLTSINVTLLEDAIGLEEVVVIGYGEKTKVTVTGAVSTITSEDLLRSPTTSVTNSLAGKITGISAVQNTGQPGADEASIFIRGIATLNDAAPLTIVDGVERPFSQIDAEEIESISILKDASATAVYGVRGANGVIIVTTKRGEAGKAKITLSTSTGFQEPTMMLDKANSEIFALGHNERNLNDGNDPLSNTFTDEMLEAFRAGGNVIYPDMDWYSYLFKDYALQTKTNLTMSGGTDRVRYFTALGYTNQGGQLKDLDPRFDQNFNFGRYNYRSNLDVDITESTLLKLTLGGRTEIRNSPRERESGMWKEANWAQPMAGSGLVDGNWISTSQDNITLEFRDPLSGFYGKGYDNQTNNILNIDLDLIQKLDFITPGLRAKVKGSYNTSYTHTKTISSSADRFEAIYMPGDSSQIVYKKIGDQGKLNYSEGTGKGRNWYMEASLDYSRRFGNHELGGLLLYNQRVSHYAGGGFNGIPRTILGLVARMTYNYKTKYLFDMNMGYNGSENFPEASRFGFFPSASLGWILSEEEFMQNVGFLDYIKIRGSYGLVGNDRLPGNRFLYLPDSWTNETVAGDLGYSGFGYGANALYGYNFGIDNPTIQPGALENLIGNPYVTWETAIKQNYGVDLKVFKGKLSLSADYFREYRKDILIQQNTVPSYVAAELPAVNLGEVKNQGYEVELRWHQKFNKDLMLRIGANMSYARNEIMFWDEIPQPHDYLYVTGNPVGQPFGYISNGFFTDTTDTSTDPAYAEQVGVRPPGDVIYEDLNSDGVIDDLDQRPVGHSTRIPEYNFGLNLYFRWKGFDLSATVSGVKNTSRILPSYFREPFGGQNRGLFTYLYDGRWTEKTAAAGTAIYPRFSKSSADNNYRNSDLWIVDASYIRLKNVEIGYNITSPVFKQMGLSNIRIYVNGYNLLTWSDFHYFDPESRPGSGGLYPMTKLYNVGLKLNF
jgi:TonB-linked SusC/RagA family outer membrane protein